MIYINSYSSSLPPSLSVQANETAVERRHTHAGLSSPFAYVFIDFVLLVCSFARSFVRLVVFLLWWFSRQGLACRSSVSIRVSEAFASSGQGRKGTQESTWLGLATTERDYQYSA